MSTTKKPASLEQQMQKIEKIVEKLEENELPLEKSLAEFEKGVTLIRSCQNLLKKAEQEVKILTDNNQLEDFDHHAD